MASIEQALVLFLTSTVWTKMWPLGLRSGGVGRRIMDVRDRRLCRSLLNKGTVPLERKKQNPPFVCYKGEAPLGLLPVFGFVSLPYFSVDWFDPGGLS